MKLPSLNRFKPQHPQPWNTTALRLWSPVSTGTTIYSSTAGGTAVTRWADTDEGGEGGEVGANA
jgi:hypothetical protein